jgi:6-phosphogluconolactonase (cycloisomerase 2 family)
MRTIIFNCWLSILHFLVFNFFLTAFFLSLLLILSFPTWAGLDFVETIQDGQGQINRLKSASSVTMSPDGNFVYVVSYGDSAITVFARNPVSKKLVFIQVIEDNVNGVDGLAGARLVAVSADGKSVYVAGSSDNAVAVLGRDPNTGLLTFLQVLKDGDSGVDGLDGASSVTVSADGKSVYVASFYDDAVAMLGRDLNDGQLTFLQVIKDGDNSGGVDGLDGARSVTVSADGKSVYVAGFNDNAVAVLGRDLNDGQLTWKQVLKDGDSGVVDGLAGAHSVTVSADGKSVYVAGFNDNAVAVLGRDLNDGQLTWKQVLKNGQAVMDGLDGAHSVTVSANDQSVYVAGYSDDAVAMLVRNKVTGQLIFQQVLKDGQDSVDGLDGASSVTVSADENSVYVASSLNDAVTVLARDKHTGLLTFQQVLKDGQNGIDGLDGAQSVTVSANHQSVYVAGYYDDAVAVFARDLDNGELTFRQFLKDGQGEMDGLDGAYSVTVSADDQSVYVAGYLDNAVAVFKRDKATGQLTFQQVLKNGQDGVEGLAGATSVTVSADGQSVYVASRVDNTVVILARDPSTGLLGFQRAIKDEEGGVNGLAEAKSVVVSHDDRFVYVTGIRDDAIAIFARTNHPPLNTLPTSLTFQKNTPTPLNLDLTDDDAGPFLPLQVTLVATNGTLTLSSTNNLTFNSGDGKDDNQLVITGKLADLKTALQGITFTPTPNFSGDATLEMITDDLGHSGYGGAKQAKDKMTFTVAFSNDKPVVETMATQYGSPGQLLQLQIKATDSDIPKQTLNYRLEDPPAGATIGYRTGQLNWTPLPEQIGTFEVKVIVNDGTDDSEPLVFQVIITDKPVLEPIANQTISVASKLTLTAKATFPGRQALSYSLKNAPAGASINERTGVLTWTPTQTGQFPLTVVVTEPLGQHTAEATFTVTVTPIVTHLDLDLSSPALFQNSELKIKGKLNSYPHQPGGLNNLEIQLAITAPDGQLTTLTTTTAASGEYHFAQPPVLTQTGQYVVQTQWVGNERLAATQSKSQTVLVSALAGYALLVQGRDASGSGEQAYSKSLNRVYRKLKYRGFIDEHIEYLSYESNPEADIQIDALPDKARIQTALQTLQTLLNNDPAPLFLVMVDHGGVDGRFYLDNGDGGTITPTELNAWLTTLEKGLNTKALSQPRVIIIGACYSGNFIPALSQPGRVIVTSTALGEESYKGPKEPDEVRSGEYFIEALFADLGQGNSLASAFELATYGTEIFTRKDDFTHFNQQFQDHAMQHPLLDDNGDQQGSNWLGSDGIKAKHLYLGLGPQYDTNAPDSPATILAVTPTLHLDANTAVAQLSAWINHPNRVKDQQVLVDIRPPSLQLTDNGIEQSGQLEIDGLQRIQLPLAAGNHFQGQFAAFAEAGQYELLYFVIDNQTGDISPFQRSSVYKNKLNNQPPTAVQLRAPADGSETQTVVIFDWKASQDPDNDPFTYTLLLGTDPALQTIVYQREGLATSMTYLDQTAVIDDPLNQGQPGLRDGTKYFWKVQAIDKYGAMAESPVFTFQTNDTNFPPGLGSLYVYNAVDFVSLENATLDFWMVDEWGNLVLDANGLPIPLSQPPDVYQDQGFYNITLPFGRRRATLRSAGYQEQEVLIDTTDGLANLRVAMTPKGGIPKQPGKLQFRVDQARFEETQGQIAILVDRVGGADGAVSVSYQILANGTATPGTDYSGATEGRLDWPNQDRSPKKILLTIQDDNQSEPEESLQLHLQNPTGGAGLGTQTEEMTITLIDDDSRLPQQPGVLQFLTMHYAASESDSTPVVTVTRTGGSEGQVSVEYLVTNESTARSNADYTGGTGKLTWASGDDEPKRLQITLIDDSAVEELETLTFTLANPTKGATLGDHQSATLTITDNDVAGVVPIPGAVQFAQSAYQADEEEGSLKTVTVTRTGGSQGQVSVQYQIAAESTAMAGSDYTLGDAGLLTWEVGDSEAKLIKIAIVDDQATESAETIQFSLLNPSGGVILGNPTQASLTISDNDQIVGDKETEPVENEQIEPTKETLPIETIGNPTTSNTGTLQFFTNTYYLNESIGSVKTFTVTRSGGNQGAVSVEYSTIGGTAEMGLDYVGGTSLLTWADGDDTPKAIDLTVLDDQEPEKAETIQLQLKNPTGNAQLGIYDRATLIIADNEEPPAPQMGIAEFEFTLPLYWAQEEDQAVPLTVTRTGSDQGEVSVQYIATVNSSATLGEDYQNGSGTLVWADGDTQPQTITLELNDDNLPEEKIIHFLLAQPTSLAALGKRNETIVVIKDNDSSTVPETTPSPTTVQFTTVFARVAEPDKEVLIPVIRTGTQGYAAVDYETIAGSATADEDYLPRQGHLVWPDGEEGVVGLIIPIVADYRGEAEKSFTLRLFNPSEGVQLGKLSQVEIRIQDQDGSVIQPLPLPNLGRGMALVNSPSIHWKTSFNCQALPCPLDAAFRGGSSLNGLSYHLQLTLDPYQYVNIRGEMDVAAEHVGQSAELLIVAAWKPINSTEPESYFMQDNQGQILPWDLNLAHLVAAQEAVTLTPTQEIYLYTGFLESGQIRLFFGYQLPDGVIVFNGEQAIELVVGKLGGN